MFREIKEYLSPNKETFVNTIKHLGEPAILRNICPDWPLIRKGREGADALFDYMKDHDNGRPLKTLLASPDIAGKFFYSDDFRSRNFGVVDQTLSQALSDLEAETKLEAPPSRYVQSVEMKQHVPKINIENVSPFLENVSPKFWIGGQTTAQTHFDFSENIALVVLGNRTVTLFPPSQLPNLYLGPLETAPGGVFVSTTNLDNPDFEKHPKFKEALNVALQGELEIGDAIYIPCGWWHHIRATAPLNMLLNYWWHEGKPFRENPRAALLYALMTFEEMHVSERVIWENLFKAIVFRTEEESPMGHLPKNSRGMLGGIGPENRQWAIKELLTVLRSG